MKPEETIDYQVKVAWHNINRMYNVEAAKYGITTAIGFVLLNIDEQTGTPATKIPSLMGLEPNSLSRMLKSLEERKLIYRETDKNDRRKVRVYLTQDGKAKREISRQTVRNFNFLLKEILPKEKLDTFFEVIQEINYLLENKGFLETADIK